MSILQNIEPVSVFHYFEEICKIPHGSSDTWMMSRYLTEFAKDRGLRYIQDSLGNVIIFKDGTKGCETAAPVMIQGHMDMVCEKDEGVDLDFSSDGLKLKLDGNVISAEGTTLGGDDGIAVAYALAILDAGGEISHPPLEVVITVDEEIGMLGAAGLDCSPLRARRMLNLDSEDEGQLLVSCAGGVTATCHIPVEYGEEMPEHARGLKLTVTGLTGGHSGVEIHKQGANASKILGRVLYALRRRRDIRLIDIQGGMKDNAIPREASACLICTSDDADGWSAFAEEWNAVLRNEYRVTDPDICLVVSDEDVRDACMTEAATKRVLASLLGLPNGVIRMSRDIEGLVQTSLNLGIMRTIRREDCGEVQFCFSVRSSVASEKEALVEQMEALVLALGGTLTAAGEYPAWEYRQESVLRDIMTDIYTEMFGREPVVEAIHAGVECGLFAGKIPGLDCVSFGPQMDDIHTPSERLYVDSVQRTWKYLLEILKRLGSCSRL